MEIFAEEKQRLYAYESLKTFVFSLIGLFIPIFVIKSGYSLYHALGYIMTTSVISIAATPYLSKLNRDHGLKHSLAASYILIIPAFLILQSLDPSYFLILSAGVLYSLGKTVHNLAMNIEFTEDTEEESREKDSSYLFSVTGLARGIGPAVGGFLLASFGMTVLSSVALVGVLLSVLPLINGVENRTSEMFSLGFQQIQDQLELLPIHFARGIQGAAAVSIFALFMFTEVGGSINAGWARSLDNIGFVIAALAAGRIGSRRGLRNILVIGSLGSAIVYFSRALIVSPLQAFLVSIAGGITFQLYQVPLYSGLSDEAEKKGEVQLYGMRKVFTGIGSGLTALVALLVVRFYDPLTAFQFTFALGGLSCLLTMYYGLQLPNTSVD